MNRSEFTALPPTLALGLIWDELHRTAPCPVLDNTEAPRLAKPPKYDSRIGRKDGVCWASECDLEGLRFWHKRAVESTNPEHAERNAKEAKALSYWIAYREQQPTAIWSGERNREQVTAKAPSGKPEVYPRDGGRRAPEPKPSSGGGYDAADGYDDAGNDDLPFASNVTGEPGERWWRR